MIEGYGYALKPFDSKPSFYCTDGFCAWWDDYYFSHSIGSVEHMLDMVESGFIGPLIEKKATVSGRGKHLSPKFICNMLISFIFTND
jgi:hypothetical protein